MILASPKLAAIPHFRHGFTTREIGADYARLAGVLAIDVSDIIIVKQIHSALVSLHPEKMIPESDALVTATPGACVAVRTADCVPILVVDPVAGACAAIHAGWRGLVGGVIENTLGLMKKSFGSGPENMMAAIGPALCQNCFEIGPEVSQEFKKRFGKHAALRAGREDKSHADLKAQCAHVLKGQGIPPGNIDNMNYCTRCHPDLFYSYRRGDKEGRQVAFVGLMALGK